MRMAGLHVDLRAVAIWAGALALVGAFAAADLAYGCAFFQRGGSALVVYAILVSIASMRARAEYGDELNGIQAEQVEIAQLMYAEEHDATGGARAALARRVDRKLGALESRLSRLADAGRRFQDLRFVEGPLLIAGTLLWGFGDLLILTPGCAL